MFAWLKALASRTWSQIDALGDAWERLLMILCATLVVPMALLAGATILLLGPSGNEVLRRSLDFDKIMPPYLTAIACLAVPLSLYSAYGRTPRAVRLAELLDRLMMPVAYTASALLLLFAVLMWLGG